MTPKSVEPKHTKYFGIKVKSSGIYNFVGFGSDALTIYLLNEEEYYRYKFTNTVKLSNVIFKKELLEADEFIKSVELPSGIYHLMFVNKSEIKVFFGFEIRSKNYITYDADWF